MNAKQAMAMIEAEKLVLADQIRKTLKLRSLDGEAARKLTGLSVADISRIKGQKISRFRLERLISVALKLGHDVTITVRNAS